MVLSSVADQGDLHKGAYAFQKLRREHYLEHERTILAMALSA